MSDHSTRLKAEIHAEFETLFADGWHLTHWFSGFRSQTRRRRHRCGTAYDGHVSIIKDSNRGDATLIDSDAPAASSTPALVEEWQVAATAHTPITLAVCYGLSASRRCSSCQDQIAAGWTTIESSSTCRARPYLTQVYQTPHLLSATGKLHHTISPLTSRHVSRTRRR